MRFPAFGQCAGAQVHPLPGASLRAGGGAVGNCTGITDSTGVVPAGLGLTALTNGPAVLKLLKLNYLKVHTYIKFTYIFI